MTECAVLLHYICTLTFSSVLLISRESCIPSSLKELACELWKAAILSSALLVV